MKRNVTFSLDEDVLMAARKKAADAGLSLQEFVRKVLAREVKPTNGNGLQEFWDLADRIGAKSDGPYLKREELYDREVLRRHEHLLVRERQTGSGKGKKGKKAT